MTNRDGNALIAPDFGQSAGTGARIASRNGGAMQATSVATPYVKEGARVPEMLVEPSTTRYLQYSVSVYSSGGVTGLTPTVALRRASDGYYLDWADATYKDSGWTTQYGTMTEIGRGHYQRTWAVGALAAGTQLVAEYRASGYDDTHSDVLVVASIASLPTAAAVAGVPDLVWDEAFSGHVSAGSFGALLDKLRLLHFGKVISVSGSPSGSITVYQDDGTTPAYTYSVTDESGGAITAAPGVPARRSAAT